VHRCLIATSAPAPLSAWSPRRYPAWAAAATLLITAAGVLACVVALLQTAPVAADFRQGTLTAICYVVPYAVAGAFLISRRPDLPFGWLLAGTAVLSAAGSGAASLAYLAASHGTSTSRWLAFVAFATSSTQFLPVAVQGLVNVRFPSGRLSSRWGRALEIALIAGTVLAFIGGVFADQPLTVVRAGVSPERVLNPLTAGTEVGRIASGLIVLIPVVILLGLVAGLGVVRRAWKATGTERYQLRWRAFGVVLALLLFPLAVTETLPLLVGLLDGLFFVVTLAIPVVRYRLWAIDTVIRRSAAYALVTVAVAGLFAVIAAAGTVLASQRTGFILAAAVAAVAFAPARSYSQRLVDRLFYGQRNDPYRALSELGRRLAAVVAPGEVLPALVTAVAESLHLPYVAVERPADGSVLAAAGQPVTAAAVRTERWPLSYHGAEVGVLVAQPRRGEQAFDPRDRAVLDDIARQAGAAVHAEALTADLLDSRQRLVSAREEERRRLRRDLHDGLGPLLTSIGLNIDAARTRAGRQPAGGPSADVGLLLGRAKDASTQAIADLRGIVYGLRPSSLDDLGLAGAIGAHIRRLGEGVDGRITLEAGGLTELPAAVEVAAFRIAVEAVNNAVRHAQARRYQVRLAIDRPGQLLVEVCDDGAGREPWPPGVGLSAMRERTAELGGTLTAGPGPGGGTVRAYLPLPVAVTLSTAGNLPVAETQPAEETP
jgi:signal transduction histidine kinase